MFTFTLIFIFFLLTVICITLGVISIGKLLRKAFYGPTYYNTQLQAKQKEMEFYRRSIKSIHYDMSIIYKIENRDMELIKSQLDSISQLMKTNFDSNYTFEIICIIPDDDFVTFRQISQLRQTNPNLRILFRKLNGIFWFVSGAAFSYGEVVIDSKYLFEEIMQIKEIDPQSRLIEFICPTFSYKSFFYDPNNISFPVLFTKKASELVLPQLHNISFGYTEELLFLCKMLNVETRIQMKKSETDEIPVFECIGNYIMSMITKFLYSKQYWTVVDHPI